MFLENILGIAGIREGIRESPSRDSREDARRHNRLALGN